jgi:hypothetical protein
LCGILFEMVLVLVLVVFVLVVFVLVVGVLVLALLLLEVPGLRNWRGWCFFFVFWKHLHPIAVASPCGACPGPSGRARIHGKLSACQTDCGRQTQ